jgi:hypothetical protein
MRTLALLLFAAACGGSTHPPAVAGARAGTPEDAAAAALARQEVVWIALRDLDGAAAALMEYARGIIPDQETLRVQLLGMMGIDERLASAIDGKRPLVMSMLEPPEGASEVGARLLLAIPVTDQGAFQNGLSDLYARAAGVRAEPGVTVYDRGEGGRVYVMYDRGWAFVTFEHGTVRAAAALLGPRARSRPAATLVVHAHPRLLARFASMEQALAGWLTPAETPGDPRAEHDSRGLHRAASYLTGADGVEALLDLSPRGVRFTLRMSGKRADAWGEFVAQKSPGPLWGAGYLPRDAVLAWAGRLSARDRELDLESLEAYLKAVAPDGDAAAQAKWHEALAAAVESATGEAVYAVWPARPRGIGAGGAFRVRDPAAAGAALTGAHAAIALALPRLAAQQLGLDPAKHRFRLKTRNARVGGASAQVLDLEPLFKGKARKGFERIFGERLTLAAAPSGDAIVWALGRDWEKRLATMLRAGAPDAATGLAATPGWARAAAFAAEGRTSLSYVPTAALAAMVLEISRARGQTGQEEVLAPFLKAEREESGIVAVTRVAERDGKLSYELTTELPPTVVRELGGMGAAMWRVAIGPVMASPTLPVLPLAPSYLTPPLE